MGTMPTTSALPRTRPDDVPERLLVLPAAQDVAGTPYAHARRLAEQAVADVGGAAVAEGDTSATALLMVRPIPVDALAAALAAHPHVPLSAARSNPSSPPVNDGCTETVCTSTAP